MKDNGDRWVRTFPHPPIRPSRSLSRSPLLFLFHLSHCKYCTRSQPAHQQMETLKNKTITTVFVHDGPTHFTLITTRAIRYDSHEGVGNSASAKIPPPVTAANGSAARKARKRSGEATVPVSIFTPELCATKNEAWPYRSMQIESFSSSLRPSLPSDSDRHGNHKRLYCYRFCCCPSSDNPAHSASGGHS